MDPTTIDALPLPPELLAEVHRWAPSVLAALLLTTLLVHALLPVARRIEMWARASAATWDDAPARRLVEVLAWLAEVTSALLAWVPRLAVGPASQSSSPRPRRPTIPPPTAALAVVAVVVAGCGSGAIGQHARAALALHHIHAASRVVIESSREADLDRVERDYPTDPEHDAQLELAGARWRAVTVALDGAGEAIRGYGEAITLARIANAGDVALVDVLPLGARVVALLARVAALVRELGVELPPLPPWVTGLLAVAGGVS